MNHYQIIPECYADTLLVEMLGFDRPNHQLGIGKVIGMFEKGLKNRIAVGIIDDDKVKPKDFDNFQVEAERDGIKRLIKDKHSILVIKPVFEDWVFENAAAVEVEPSKFGFHSRKQFREACKKMDAKKILNCGNSSTPSSKNKPLASPNSKPGFAKERV